MGLLEIQKGTKIYLQGTEAQVIAFSDLNIAIEKGESLAIMGRSGAGKSTLMHILGCLDQLTAGSYYLDGQDISKATPKELARIRNKKMGFVLQNFGLINSKTVYDNIAIPLWFNPDVRKKDMKEKIQKAIADMGLTEKEKALVTNLSGGQKQRVAIARALVNNPEIILADEPTGSLDRQTAEETMDVLLQLHEQGRTLIVVTHDIHVAEKCARQYVML